LRTGPPGVQKRVSPREGMISARFYTGFAYVTETGLKLSFRING
jgi:hypothetical protein